MFCKYIPLCLQGPLNQWQLLFPRITHFLLRSRITLTDPLDTRTSTYCTECFNVLLKAYAHFLFSVKKVYLNPINRARVCATAFQWEFVLACVVGLRLRIVIFIYCFDLFVFIYCFITQALWSLLRLWLCSSAAHINMTYLVIRRLKHHMKREVYKSVLNIWPNSKKKKKKSICEKQLVLGLVSMSWGNSLHLSRLFQTKSLRAGFIGSIC